MSLSFVYNVCFISMQSQKSQKLNILLNPTLKHFYTHFGGDCTHQSQPSNLLPSIDNVYQWLQTCHPLLTQLCVVFIFQIGVFKYIVFLDFVKLYWLWCVCIVHWLKLYTMLELYLHILRVLVNGLQTP